MRKKKRTQKRLIGRVSNKLAINRNLEAEVCKAVLAVVKDPNKVELVSDPIFEPDPKLYPVKAARPRKKKHQIQTEERGDSIWLFGVGTTRKPGSYRS